MGDSRKQTAHTRHDANVCAKPRKAGWMSLYPGWAIPGFSQAWLHLIIMSNLACQTKLRAQRCSDIPKASTDNAAGKGHTQHRQPWHWIHSSSTWNGQQGLQGHSYCHTQRESHKDQENTAN